MENQSLLRIPGVDGFQLYRLSSIATGQLLRAWVSDCLASRERRQISLDFLLHV